MLLNCTVKCARTEGAYMGRRVEGPEVITEGETREECRAMLQDA